MKKLLRNKRKGHAHFSYMKSLQNPEPNPNILTLHVSYGGLLVKQSKAAKRLRKNRAKPWKYLWSKGPSIRGKPITQYGLGVKEYAKNLADQLNAHCMAASEHMNQSVDKFFDEWMALRKRSPLIFSHSINTKPKENT